MSSPKGAELAEDNIRAGFALVLTGTALTHALHPDLELWFLGVAELCNGKLELPFVQSISS